MKAVSVDEDAGQVLDQFQQLAGEQRCSGLARFAMLLAAGRYCRSHHLSIGRQSIFQRKLMENHHEH